MKTNMNSGKKNRIYFQSILRGILHKYLTDYQKTFVH